jgi:hypothetical protein
MAGTTVRAIEIEVNIDGGDSVKELQTVEEALTGIEKNLRNISKSDVAEKTAANFKAINAIVEENALSVQDMTKAMESYVNIAATAGRESPIGKEALQRAGAMKDQIDGLSTEVQQLAKDGQNLQAALQLGGTVVAGYQGFQSTIALLGVENEQLLQTMVKLEAANGLLLSIEQIRMSLEKESVLVQKAQAFWSSAQTKAVTIQTKAKKKDIAVTGVVTAAQWLWNKAILANPIISMIVGIGALIGGLVLLANAFGDAEEGIDKAAVQQEAWNDAIKTAGEATVSQRTKLDLLVNSIKDETLSTKVRNQALKEAKEIGGAYLEWLTLQNIATEEGAALIDTYVEALNNKAKAEAIQETLVEKNRKILELRNTQLSEFITVSVDANGVLLGTTTQEEEVAKALESGNVERERQIDLINQEIDAITELAKPLEANRLEIEATEQAMSEASDAEDERNKKRDEASKKRRTDAKKDADDAKKAEEKRISDLIAAQNMVDGLIIEMMSEGEEKAVSQRQAQFDAKIAKLETDGQLTTELEKLLTQKSEDDIIKIREAAFDERTAKELAIMRSRQDLRIEVMMEGADKEIAANEAVFALRMEQLELEGILTDELEQELTEENARKIEEVREKWRKITKEKDDIALKTKLDNAAKELDTLSQGVETFGELNSAFSEMQLNKAGDDAQKREAIERKQFEREKKLNIARALIGGAQAAIQAIAKFGPPPSPLGIAGIASAGLITAAQIAAISSAKFQGSGSASIPTVAGSSAQGGSSPGAGNDDSINATAPFLGGDAPGQPKLVVSAVDISNVQNTTQKIEVIRTLD